MIKRGQIYYIESNRQNMPTDSEQYAGRPAIIVSNDKNNKYSEVVEIVYLTTQPKNELPTHVRIRSSNRVSTALCEQVTTVSVSRIGDYVATCTDAEMMNIDTALVISLGIDFGCLENAPNSDEHNEDISNEPQQSQNSDESCNEEYIKVCTELEVYKHQYEWLVDRFLGRSK